MNDMAEEVESLIEGYEYVKQLIEEGNLSEAVDEMECHNGTGTTLLTKLRKMEEADES